MTITENAHEQSASSAIPIAPVALAAVAVAMYSGVVVELIREWSSDPLYSYGFAVPLIAGYVVANRWAQFRSSIGTPDYIFGSLLVVTAALTFVIGEAGTALRLQELSLVLMVAGLALLAFGRRAFRHLWFAAAYLLLMVPIWTDLISRLQVPSQILSGRIALALFHAIGIPALQEGTLIDLPHVTLEVLRECSGVNQLVAIFAITVPAAYLWIDGRVRRALVVAVSLLIGYLSNGARIALVGILAQNGFDTTTPRLHLAEGLVVAMLGYGLIAAVFSVLAKPGWFASSGGDPQAGSHIGPAQRERRVWLDASLAVVVLLSAGSRWLLPRTDVALRADLSSLPGAIGAWTREPAWDSAEGDSEADDDVRLTYRRTTGERVHLFIGYQRYQQAGKGLIEALPKDVHGIESVYDVRITANLTQLTQIQQTAPGSAKGALYWFDVDGQSVADKYEAKRHLLWNTLTRRRSNGAAIMVSWDVSPGVGFEASRERAVDFIRSIVPMLPKCLPSRA